MREKKTAAGAAESGDQVRLKPVFGVRPGVYLAWIYAAVLLAILFFVLVFPGMRRLGSVVVFSSEPSGAAIRVDGVYAGTSPARFFVPAGSRSVEVVLPGFEPAFSQHVIPRRVFGSWIFPRRYALSVTLFTDDPIGVLAMSAAEYAQWSFGGEATAAWQVPRTLSEGVYRIGAVAAGEEAAEIIAASARFADTRVGLRELVRAKTLADGGGNSPSPAALARSVADILAFLDANPAGAQWLAGTLPANAAEAVTSSEWYRRRHAEIGRMVAGQSLAPNPAGVVPQDVGLPVGQIRVGGLLFMGLGGGTLVQGEPFPHEVPVEPFLVSTEQVPPSVFADFVEANPRWSRANLETLEREGLVTGDYLADFGLLAPGWGWTGTGIYAVSWFAARAFCEWLTGLLPDFLSGWEVRLPTEAQWEFAAKSARLWDNFNGVFVPNGGSWEWTDDPFSPLPFFPAPERAVDSPERSVRGGSWLSDAGVTGVETRAFLPPATSSPFVSFRPIIARKNTDD